MKIKSVDHLGNSFKSKAAMCKYYGVSVGDYYRRLNQGYSLEEILEGRIKRRPTKAGYTMSEIRSFAAQSGISVYVLWKRLSKGMSVDEAIDMGCKSSKLAVVGHDGVEYPSISAYCRVYGMKPYVFRHWRDRGLTAQEIYDLVKEREEQVIDHEGVKYVSIKAMCDAWGVDYQFYRKKLLEGCTKEEILTFGPASSRTLVDHTGRRFKKVDDLCKHWGIPRYVLNYRLRKGWLLEEALTTPVRTYNKEE